MGLKSQPLSRNVEVMPIAASIVFSRCRDHKAMHDFIAGIRMQRHCTSLLPKALIKDRCDDGTGDKLGVPLGTAAFVFGKTTFNYLAQILARPSRHLRHPSPFYMQMKTLG